MACAGVFSHVPDGSTQWCADGRARIGGLGERRMQSEAHAQPAVVWADLAVKHLLNLAETAQVVGRNWTGLADNLCRVKRIPSPIPAKPSASLLQHEAHPCQFVLRWSSVRSASAEPSMPLLLRWWGATGRGCRTTRAE